MASDRPQAVAIWAIERETAGQNEIVPQMRATTATLDVVAAIGLEDVGTRQQQYRHQEVITLIVFAGFSAAYLREPLTWNQGVGFALIAVGAFFVFRSPLS
jgi:drug/metabolite transporter (DMT)-like permease